MLSHHRHPRTMWLLLFAAAVRGRDHPLVSAKGLDARSDPSLSKLSFGVSASMWRAPFPRSLAKAPGRVAHR
jgi:hypothetical protein